MAKAIVGHIGEPQAQNTYQTALLRRHVAELQEQVSRLKAENDALCAALAERVEDFHPDQLLESISR